MAKVAVSAGHSLNTPGKRSPDGEREWAFNNKIVRAFINELENYEDVEILRVDDATGAVDVPLKVRTNLVNAFGANAYVDIHCNAASGMWGKHGGTETYIHPEAGTNTVELAKEVHSRLLKATGLRDRGIKRANLHSLRETNMPAILPEIGFMDSYSDIVVLRDDMKLKIAGAEIAHGVAAWLKLKRKKVPQSLTLAADVPTETEVSVLDKKFSPPASIADSVSRVLMRLSDQTVHGDKALSASHRDQFLKGEMNLTTALGLLYVAIDRGMIQGNK